MPATIILEAAGAPLNVIETAPVPRDAPNAVAPVGVEVLYQVT